MIEDIEGNPWRPRTLKPSESKVYQRLIGPIPGLTTTQQLDYSLWNGRRWKCGSNTVKDAAEAWLGTGLDDFKWREVPTQ